MANGGDGPDAETPPLLLLLLLLLLLPICRREVGGGGGGGGGGEGDGGDRAVCSCERGGSCHPAKGAVAKVATVPLLLLLAPRTPVLEDTCGGFCHEACNLSTEAGGLDEVVSGCSDRE